MDGLSAGASVLAFVAAALEASRAIYGIVSSVRSGSPDVCNLASSADGLERVLSQLLTLLESQSHLQSSQHIVPVGQTIQQCVLDLDHICQQLCSLEHQSPASAAKKVWRLVKIAVKKDDIQRMTRIIQQHVSMLTLQVVILSSRESSRYLQLLSGLTQTAHGPQYSNQPSARAQGEQGSEARAFRRDTSATLLAIRSKLDCLVPSASSEFIETRSALEQIELQVAKGADIAPPAQTSARGDLLQWTSDDLEESLQRLSELAQQEGRKVHSFQADDIVEDIDVLIDALLGQYSNEKPTNRKRKRSASSAKNGDSERALKLIKSIVNTNDCVHVNLNERPIRQYASRTKRTVERRSRTFALPQGTASVFTKVVKSCDHYERENGREARVLGFSATLEYLPSSDFPFAKIVTNVVQRAGLFGSTTLYPSLTVSPVIPAQSEVFLAIQGGDLAAMQVLLQRGKASLRDCDPQGRSLLGHACFNDKPDICKFLLEHGADGDAVENVDSRNGSFGYLPLLLHCGTYDPTLECHRLLLASGADPSKANEDELGPFELALYKPVLLKHIIHYAREWINTEERDSHGDTLLLRFMDRYIYNPRALKFLLELGADLHARTSQGNTCLHLCFRKACRYNADLRYDDLNLLPCVAMLIRAGADVCAINWTGESVSYTALQTRHDQDDPSQCDIGSFPMDVWTTALKKCGYHPPSIMCEAALSHKVRFTDKYREEHFQALQKWEPWMTSRVFDGTSQEWVEPA